MVSAAFLTVKNDMIEVNDPEFYASLMRKFEEFRAEEEMLGNFQWSSGKYGFRDWMTYKFCCHVGLNGTLHFVREKDYIWLSLQV